MFFKIIIFSLIMLFLCSLDAQEDNRNLAPSDSIKIITVSDGSVFIGKIIQNIGDTIYCSTEFGDVKIPLDKIKSVENLAKDNNTKNWFENPNISRLYFAPSGRSLKKGEGYFADYYLIFPMVGYGLTDNLTVAGGMSLIPGLNPDKQMFYILPKYRFLSKEKLNLSAGFMGVLFPKIEDMENNSAGIIYSVGTYGTIDKSLSMGLGYGFVNGEFEKNPMLMIGGEYRFSRRLAVVSENWNFPGFNTPVISYGIRFMGEKITTDLALINPLSKEAIFPGFPYIDFVFKF